ncbi:unnamed protein product [Meloidogyne enterolobii]|uniref:Uncharacterized protein n=1 Tax=Meloidogyne enterolobii TaxID=390850 RepID=A0ACB0Y7J1_MELEN
MVNFSSMGPVFDKNLSYQALPNPDPYPYNNGTIDGRHYSGYVPSGVSYAANTTTTDSFNNNINGTCNSTNNSLQRRATTLMRTFQDYNNGGVVNYDTSSTVKGSKGAGSRSIISGRDSIRGGGSVGGGEFL